MTVRVIYTDGYTSYYGYASVDGLKIEDGCLYISVYGNIRLVEEVLGYASVY